MTDDPKLAHMGKVLDIIATTNTLADALEALMNDHPGTEYTIPTEHLVVIAAQLKLCGRLASNLFEENQTIADRVESIMLKLSAKKD